MKHENADKPWIRQSFFHLCFKIIISPNFFTAKVLFYTVLAWNSTLDRNDVPSAWLYGQDHLWATSHLVSSPGEVFPPPSPPSPPLLPLTHPLVTLG